LRETTANCLVNKRKIFKAETQRKITRRDPSVKIGRSRPEKIGKKEEKKERANGEKEKPALGVSRPNKGTSKKSYSSVKAGIFYY